MALGVSLREYGNSVLLWDSDGDGRMIANHKIKDGTLDIIKDIDSGRVESADCLILSQKFFTGNSDFIEHFTKKIKQIEDKVFLDVEVAHGLFPKNKFIAIFGNSYEKIIHAVLNHLFGEAQTNIIKLPLSMNSDESGDKNSNDELNLDDSNVFLLDIGAHRIEYLKNLSFDVLAILTIEHEEQAIFIKNLISKQGEDNLTLINIDNGLLKEVWNSYSDVNAPTPLSLEKMVENGYSYVNDTIYNYYDSNASYDLTNGELIGSAINRLSVLFSFIVACRLGLDPLSVRTSLQSFRGLAHNMEQVGHNKNIVFIDNLDANTIDLLESPFKIYGNVYTIFLANGKASGNPIRLKDHKNNIKMAFLIDTFDIVDLKSEEFGSIKLEKINNIKSALDRIINNIGEQITEEEVVVLISPIFENKTNGSYYNEYGDEFKKLIENL